MIPWGFLPWVAARRHRVTRRSGRRCSGATVCSRSRSGSCSGGFRCSWGAGRWQPPRRWAAEARQVLDLLCALVDKSLALPLFREADEDGIAAQTHTFLGTVLLLQGDHEGAKRRFEEGLALARSLGDRVSMHSALFNLAQLALAEGDHEAAFLRFVEGIALSEELGDRGA